MLALMAGVVALTACSDDLINGNANGNPVYTFTAQTEGDGAASRATIDGMDIKWQADDAISIFDGTTFRDAGTYGYGLYWSSTPNKTDRPTDAKPSAIKLAWIAEVRRKKTDRSTE